MIRKDKQLLIRLPEYLFRKLRMSSAKSYKSMNLIVIEILRDNLK